MNKLPKSTIDDLYHVLVHVTQLKEKIIGISDSLEQSIPVSEYPPSVLPTWLLWNILEGYTEMYNILLNYELIKSGQPKQTQKVH